MTGDARGRETRAALLASGREAFARRGFDGASIREITGAAGANLGAVTYHFGSKRGLYSAILQTALAPLVDRVAEAADDEGTPMARIEKVVDAFFDHLGENPDLPRLLLQEVAAGKAPPAEVVTILRRNATLVSGILIEGFGDGSMRPGHPLLTALSVVSQPIYMSIVAPMAREVGGLDLRDPATRSAVASHMKAFIRAGLETREEAGT